MMNYKMTGDYELIAKHCPRYESPVRAQVEHVVERRDADHLRRRLAHHAHPLATRGNVVLARALVRELVPAPFNGQMRG